MVDVSSLRSQLDARKAALLRDVYELEILERKQGELTQEINQLKEDISAYDQVAIFLNSLGERRQLEVQSQIEEIVTRGLQTVLDDTLSFHLVVSNKGKSQVVEFLVRTKSRLGNNVDTPVMDARGGGLVVTVSFLLRLSMRLLTRTPGKTCVMLLDETFAFLSEEYIPNMAAFLKTVADEADVQFILVTHTPALAEYADVVYNVSLVNEVSKIRRLK